MTSTPPRILLVEDDPVSRTFLGAAIQALPALVDAADTMAAAIALAAASRYDAWLIDANLPDGHGAQLLARLRLRDAATPALAHTAARDADVMEALHAAGFQEVLVKPLPAAMVQAALQRTLGIASTDSSTSGSVPEPLQDWDDEIAARALNGNREHIAALRKLFIAELPAVLERVRNAFRNEDFQGLHAELHRLRASCGFVGAARLQRAVQSLGDDDRSHERLQEFTTAVQTLMEHGEPAVAAGR